MVYILQCKDFTPFIDIFVLMPGGQASKELTKPIVRVHYNVIDYMYFHVQLNEHEMCLNLEVIKPFSCSSQLNLFI